MIWLWILGGAAPASAQEFRITQATLDSNNRPHVEFPGNATNYYVLHRGNDVFTITNPVALLLGSDGPMEFTGAVLAPAPSAVFFRVGRYSQAQPADVDGDGIDDLWELARAGTLSPFNSADAQSTAPSGKSYLTEYQAATFPPTKAIETSPANGESGVAVTRETVFRFNVSLAPSTVLNTNNLCACFGGRQILSRIELSSDRKKVTLFYQEPLPASARVRVTFSGTNLVDSLGRALDLDGDGQPGGNAIVDFDTLSITPVARTAVIGHIYASVQVPVVSTNSTTNFVDHPLPGVLVSVIGAEQEIFTTTDAQGFFRLTNCPAGKFFVSIDGRTSPESSWPDGDYYPLVGKPWEAVAGRTNNLAGGTGLIYLPRVQAGTLQPVNPTADTTIGFPPEVIAANPAWAGVSVTIPTNALYSDNGTRGGRVGLAPVPADRLPERLPAGIVHALDISIQTDGPQNVDRPLPVRFPNLPDPETGLKLPPGAKSALMSYNHDTGRWEVQGPMTVTADGNYVETDPGVGVRQPGWHGTMQGTQGGGGAITGPPPCSVPSTDPCKECANGQLVSKPDMQLTPWVPSLVITVPNPTCADLGGVVLGTKTVRCWKLIDTFEVTAPNGDCLICSCKWQLIQIQNITICQRQRPEEAWFCESGVRILKHRLNTVIEELTETIPVLGTVTELVPGACTGFGCACNPPQSGILGVEDRDIQFCN